MEQKKEIDLLTGAIFQLFIPEAEILPMGVDYLRILGYSGSLCIDEYVTWFK